jgi:plasmid stabilization system protein ParE
MSKKVAKVVWTRQAREALTTILDYRYKNISAARKIVRSDIINSSTQLIFATQFQKDDIYPQYRRIIVRDYKVLYKELKGIVYIMNVACTKSM